MRFHGFLLPYIRTPEKFFPDIVIYFDQDYVIIRDLYPKAQHHYLTMPRNLPTASTILQLRREHLDVVQHLKQLSLDKIPILSSNKNELDGKQKCKPAVKMGFHAVPSAVPLHLHIISWDLQSPSLKTKIHWNSFTTDFFVPIDKVIRDLDESGRVQLGCDDDEAAIVEYMTQLEKTTSLRCHICHQLQPNMPKLKAHIENCICE